MNAQSFVDISASGRSRSMCRTVCALYAVCMGPCTRSTAGDCVCACERVCMADVCSVCITHTLCTQFPSVSFFTRTLIHCADAHAACICMRVLGTHTHTHTIAVNESELYSIPNDIRPITWKQRCGHTQPPVCYSCRRCISLRHR